MQDSGGGDGGSVGGGGDVASSTPADVSTPSASDQSIPSEILATTTAVATQPAKKDPRSLLTKALEALQVGKRKKLDKVLALAQQKRSVTNDDVQKALRVSDATATRYLSQLVKEGKLKMVGHPKHASYEPV